MKKSILICLLSIICTTLYPQLLVENFDYEQGSLLTKNGWFTQYGEDSELSVTNGLSFDNYAETNIGNAALLDIEERNQLHKSFAEVTSGNIYVAFMFQPTIVGKDGWFFSLRDNKLDYTNFNFRARIWMTMFNKIGLTMSDSNKKVFANDELDASKTYLIVLKYAIKSGSNNDEVSLYVFDQFPENEPEIATIGPLSDATQTDISPANIVLRSYDSGNWLVSDGIRVATTWEEAVKKLETSPVENRFVAQNRVFVDGQKLCISLREPMSNVAIFDISGKKVTKEGLNLVAGDHKFTLKQGIYLVKIGDSTQKIIVK